ncbi:A disintegrin and metalloproteinase with thrombospondin motifs like isoform X2 [Planococcus citri]|uniref:A disintegrin and metalloproteinase with thrombospondin motifs like isoform X2 n=1 Tax=Planococcus citri TaxID=170843 RepID=UPI0031F828EA
MALRSKWMLMLSLLNVTALTTQRNLNIASYKIHHHMDVNDLRNVFQVEQHSDVPEYEIVNLHSIRKREIANTTNSSKDKRKINDKLLKLQAFGKSHELSLQPLDQQLFKGNLKMWSAESDGNGSISYTELPDAYVGDPYQDEENQAALLLHEDNDDGSLLMEGTIGHDLVIKPLPIHLRKHLNQVKTYSAKESDDLEESNSDGDEMFLDKEMSLGQDQIARNGFPLDKEDKSLSKIHPQHVVYRRHSQDNNDVKFSDFAFMEAGDIKKNKQNTETVRKKRSIVKREAPYTIYPEILVIVDYDGYRLHGGDNVQVKRYFVSFWNGVDLRYKLLKGPKVRISIAGLIISRGRDATPYLERNRVGRDAVDSAAALTDMGKYLFRERRLPVYDIAVAVTKYDMCRRRKGGRCTKGTAGFAYVGGACVVNKRLEKVNSVAIIEDTGGFSGIIVAAHEVGHLLGAVHDGSPPPTYLGGPGAEKCRWEDGFIMSDLRHSEKGFKWSACSVSSFHHFLNGDTATCLYNSPHEDESLPRVLPGKLLSLDAQCRRDRGTSACFKDERVCSQLFCFDSGSGYCVAYRPAAEGSPCGDGQSCSNGICISEHENIIPDYSQNTPSYLRRQDQDIYGRTLYGNSTQRSEWEEFWRTATDSGLPNKNTYNGYMQTTTTSYDLYNLYDNPDPSTTQNYHYYYQTQPTTTKNPYDEFNKNWYYSAFKQKLPQKNNYDWYPKKPAKSSLEEFNNLFYSRTTQQNDIYTNTKRDQVGNDDCIDTTTELPGAVSCYDFLTKYGLQYCVDEYIKKYCCAAVKYLCNNSPF